MSVLHSGVIKLYLENSLATACKTVVDSRAYTTRGIVPLAASDQYLFVVIESVSSFLIYIGFCMGSYAADPTFMKRLRT
jgi:hypothetical protein